MRLRPKVMTVATTVAGLLPIGWSHEVGSEIIRPLAVPVLGGMLSSAVHILIVTPVLFALLRQRSLRRPNERKHYAMNLGSKKYIGARSSTLKAAT